MKVRFSDYRTGAEVNLIPESLQEVAALLRVVKNAKVKPIQLYLSFSEYTTDGIPYLNISIDKLRESKQNNSIRK